MEVTCCLRELDELRTERERCQAEIAAQFTTVPRVPTWTTPTRVPAASWPGTGPRPQVGRAPTCVVAEASEVPLVDYVEGQPHLRVLQNAEYLSIPSDLVDDETQRRRRMRHARSRPNVRSWRKAVIDNRVLWEQSGLTIRAYPGLRRCGLCLSKRSADVKQRATCRLVQ